MFVDGSEPECIDRPLFFDSCIDLCYFIICSKVEDSDKAIRVTTCRHGILLVELGHHQFVLFWYDSFHEDFVFEGYFLDDSE